MQLSDKILAKYTVEEHRRLEDIDSDSMLLRHIKDTFVTPVFIGSAGLRSAAGQLIENTVKGARRKQEMNDAFIEKQYSEVRSLYRLERQEESSQGIPAESRALLAAVAGIWVLIGLYRGWAHLRQKQRKS